MADRDLLKGWQYWMSERMRKRVWDFMKAIPLPDKFLTRKHFAMMTLLLFPTMHGKKPIDRMYVSELEEFKRDINVCCLEGFKENNIQKRHIFFGEPFIQFLWGELFTISRPELIINHLRRVRTHPLDGEYRYQMIVSDMLHVEQTYNMKIIPETARNGGAIKEFTPEEAEEDLAENCKYNRRST